MSLSVQIKSRPANAPQLAQARAFIQSSSLFRETNERPHIVLWYVAAGQSVGTHQGPGWGIVRYGQLLTQDASFSVISRRLADGTTQLAAALSKLLRGQISPTGSGKFRLYGIWSLTGVRIGQVGVTRSSTVTSSGTGLSDDHAYWKWNTGQSWPSAGFQLIVEQDMAPQSAVSKGHTKKAQLFTNPTFEATQGSISHSGVTQSWQMLDSSNTLIGYAAQIGSDKKKFRFYASGSDPYLPLSVVFAPKALPSSGSFYPSTDTFVAST